jgi:hypothetical protein
VLLGLVAGQFPSGRDDVLVEWTDGMVMLAFALAGLGVLLLRTGWKHDVRGAADVLASDNRAPIVYLRSFTDDVRSPIGGAFGIWLKLVMWLLPVSFEQELAAIMNRLGPFVAVGRPGTAYVVADPDASTTGEDGFQILEHLNAVRADRA